MGKTVVVVGASPKPERYSNIALKMLRDMGHAVIPVNPAFDEIEGIPVRRDLRDISEPIDTVTMYVGPDRGEALIGDIAALKPRRVILNPGAESSEIRRSLEAKGIEVLVVRPISSFT